MLPPFILFALGGGGDDALVTLSGNTVLAIDGIAAYDSFAAHRFRSDGDVEEGESIDGGAISFTQIDTVTDWVRPATAGGADFEVRVTSVDHNAGIDNGSGWQSSPGADGTWFSLGSDRIWIINETAAGSYDTVATVEIRDTVTMAVLASTVYTWLIRNII